MFNLPFPTDSLYKFSFVFGLALIVFSFYYEDSHLNLYDKKQAAFAADSIERKWYTNELLPIIHYDGYKQSLILELQYRLDSLYICEKNNERAKSDYLIEEIMPLASYIYSNLNLNTNSRLASHLINYNALQSSLPSYKDSVFLAIHKMKEVLAGQNWRIQRELYLIKKQIYSYNQKLWFLRIVGLILFFPGLLLWYIKIQKPQDKILQLQLEEALKKSTEVPKTPVTHPIVRGR